MESTKLIERTPEELEAFAKKINVPLKTVLKAADKWDWHLRWEYDYIKEKHSID